LISMKKRRARNEGRLLELDEVERRLKPFGPTAGSRTRVRRCAFA